MISRCVRGALLVSLSAAPAGLPAQARPGEGPRPVRAWAGAGLGLSNYGAGTGRIGAAIGTPAWEGGVRWSKTEGRQERIDMDFFGAQNIREEFYELALLVGRRIRRSSGANLVVSGGVARVTGRAATETGIAGFPDRIGVPLELHYYARVRDRLGLGAGIFANIHSERSFGGAFVSLLFIPLGHR